jgi:hypothetical protein
LDNFLDELGSLDGSINSFADGSENNLNSINNLDSIDGLANGSADDFGSEASSEASGRERGSY